MESTKITTQWHSQRLECEVNVARWGHLGTPVLLFPTAGGDAEENERFLMLDVLAPLLDAGRAKVYSCDSVAGRAIAREEGSTGHRMWILNQFQQFVREELVPAIWTDCETEGLDIVAAGASIGAFNALAAICRYPEVFSHAVCMSGTYDIHRFIRGDVTEDFYIASPLHYMPGLTGDTLTQLQKRFVLFASGEGRAEDIEESWRAASLLGGKGVPNRVDSWGKEWHHDWPTWRNMLPQYLDEVLP